MTAGCQSKGARKPEVGWQLQLFVVVLSLYSTGGSFGWNFDSLFGWEDDPLVGWIVVEVPNAFRTCHDVEIVGFVSVRDNHGMVTSRHEDDIAVLDCHGLVKVTRVAVDTVEDKALRRIDTMIVGFLEQAFYGDIVDVVLVRRQRSWHRRRCCRPCLRSYNGFAWRFRAQKKRS